MKNNIKNTVKNIGFDILSCIVTYGLIPVSNEWCNNKAFRIFMKTGFSVIVSLLTNLAIMEIVERIIF